MTNYYHDPLLYTEMGAASMDVYVFHSGESSSNYQSRRNDYCILSKISAGIINYS